MSTEGTQALINRRAVRFRNRILRVIGGFKLKFIPAHHRNGPYPIALHLDHGNSFQECRLAGKEDALEAEAGQDIYTDPDEASRFVAETGVDSLAVAIGTAHGFYKGVPRLDFQRLEELRNAVPVPLVLHGASGLPGRDIAQAVKLGVCKVNFATELRFAYTQAVRTALAADPQMYDPKKFGILGREAVRELVRSRIALCVGA